MFTGAAILIVLLVVGFIHSRNSGGFGDEPGSEADWLAAQPQLTVGRDFSGTVEETEAGDFVKVYQFTGRAGEPLAVITVSTEFDTALEVGYLHSDSFVVVAEDSNSGVGTNAQLVG